MNRTRSGSAEFTVPNQPQQMRTVESDDALFDLVPDVSADTQTEPVSHDAVDKPVSQAWAELGSRERFVLPRGLGRESLDALHVMSPNPQTERAIRRDDMNQHYGLMGDVVLTDEQQENLRAAAKQGQANRVVRRINSGMSEQEAVAREMVLRTRQGRDPKEIAL